MIKKIEVHRYTLKPRSWLAPKGAGRSGALLRVTFSDLESAGVADLFPWPEFGDPSLPAWFEELKTLDPSSMTPRLALQAARDEAVAISKSEPLVKGSVVNHWLATDAAGLGAGDLLEARRSMSPAIKIKIGFRDPIEEAAALSRLTSFWGSIRLRLDANERTTRESVLRFLDSLPILVREAIEFIEDPFAFDLRTWREFHRETGLAVAYDRGTLARLREDDSGLDRIFDEGAAQVLIHKPAWQDEARAVYARERGIPVVVTSILGHPVGSLWAAAKAFEIAPEGVHGCKSHVAYRDDEASLTLVKSKQVRASRIVGLGVGLGLQSKWWKNIRWEPLT